MSIMTQTYTHPSLFLKTQETHHKVFMDLEQIAARLGKPTLSPMDILIHPEANGTPTIDKTTAADITKAICNQKPTTVQWADYGVYNRIQCAVMDKTHQFAACCKDYLQLDMNNPDIKTHQIQKIGSIALHSSTALAAKYMWIYYNHLIYGDFQAQPDPRKWFLGNVSVTSPVKKFFKKILHTAVNSIHQATQMTFDIAAQCQSDPVTINTAMWLMGKDI